MADRRWKDHPWYVVTADGKEYESTNQAQLLAVLMDIRDEMKAMNRIIQCPNFISIPAKLDRIQLNTRRRKKRAVGKPKLRVVGR